ncbi:MAG: glycosyltransferase family 4 protein [Endomicrobia bacterium]|nr:glycosyltransferase family 4 protein [Endomicrobiia bacterium]
MKDKIKVLHIITKLELGGAQQNTLYTVENLDKNKFEVYLIAGRGGILDNTAILLAKTNNFKLFFCSYLIREINPIKDFLAFIELIELVIIIKPDILHTHSSKAGVLGRWAAFIVKCLTLNLIKLKIIHTFHGFAFSKFHKFFVRMFYIIIEFYTGIISDKLIFVSNDNISTAKKYKIGSPKKYILIRSGIKIKKFYALSFNSELKSAKKKQMGFPEEEKIISTIGPFKPQKNLSDFIRMAKIITEKLPEEKITFLIAGDGEQRNMLISFAKQLGVENRIKFLSWCKNVEDLLTITDIFVMTSLWEGLPRSAVEALTSGVPVVCYAVDGLNDIIKSGINGFLISPKDVNELSEKVVLLLKNNKQLEYLKKNSVDSIDISFDIDYMVQQQEILYIKLLNK